MFYLSAVHLTLLSASPTDVSLLPGHQQFVISEIRRWMPGGMMQPHLPLFGLGSPSPQIILIKRSKACVATKSETQALDGTSFLPQRTISLTHDHQVRCHHGATR